MEIYGYKAIKTKNLCKIKNKQDLAKLPQNSFAFFKFDEQMIQICIEKKLEFCINAVSLKEVILANSFGSKLIVVSQNLLKIAQETAEHYLFDSKIAFVISNLDEIESLAKLKIDAAVLKEGITNV